MGDRANVRWKDDDGGTIHFYTHWDGSALPEIVARGLNRGRDRWDDDSYLARIVFCHMVGTRWGELTGYGISTYTPDGEDRLVTVDARAKTVTGFDGVTMTFEDFVAKYVPEEEREPAPKRPW